MLDGRFARGSQLSHVLQVWLPALLLTIAAAAQLKSLAVLELGDELSARRGIDVQPSRWGIAVTGVLLSAAGFAVSGPIPFVALMAGPFSSRLTDARSLKGKLTSAAAAGALVTVLADLFARVALSGIQLPVGVMTGLIGAPYLLWRLSREMERGEL